MHLSKLDNMGYVEIREEIKGKMPLTVCRLTGEGKRAYSEYTRAIPEHPVAQRGGAKKGVVTVRMTSHLGANDNAAPPGRQWARPHQPNPARLSAILERPVFPGWWHCGR